MTLILTVADNKGAYQSSDFRLTDIKTGAPISTDAGSKQLEVTHQQMNLSIAFTGVAWVESTTGRIETVDLLRAALKALPPTSGLNAVCAEISNQCQTVTRPLGPRGVLTIVITAATVGRPFQIAVVSNADWKTKPPTAKSRFTITVDTVTKPFSLISGYRDCVPDQQRKQLKALARNLDRPVEAIFSSLREINRIAAVRSKDYVSEDCWTTSQIADGLSRRMASRGTGQIQGAVPQILAGLDIQEWIKQNFRVAPGKEIQFVQAAGMLAHSSAMVPLPAPQGEAREFTLRWSADRSVLRSLTGQELMMLDVVPALGPIMLRLNEEKCVPMGNVVVHATAPVGTVLPMMKLPLPQIATFMTLDGVPIPDAWPLSVGYQIESDKHQVTIPLSSKGVRNLSFLGPDEELVIAMPVTTIEFELSHGELRSMPIEARVSWRQRFDGTRG